MAGLSKMQWEDFIARIREWVRIYKHDRNMAEIMLQYCVDHYVLIYKMP